MTSSWQWPQVVTISRMKPWASVLVISCDEWQSLHMGRRVSPWASPVKWMLFLKVSKMPSWQLAQVPMMLARWMVERMSLSGSTWCAVWQSLQVAETTRPLCCTAWPCTLMA